MKSNPAKYGCERSIYTKLARRIINCRLITTFRYKRNAYLQATEIPRLLKTPQLRGRSFVTNDYWLLFTLGTDARET